MGISRATGYKWWKRFCEEGVEGLVDRSSRPRHCPHRTAASLEAQIAELRRELKLGPARIGYRLGVAPSTVHRVLVRLGLNRLSWMDRPTGRVIRRYERARTGELVHVDIKKLGRIPVGGGWKVLGRQAGIKNNDGHGSSRVGYAFIHSAVDDHSRLAYSEILQRTQGDRGGFLGPSPIVVRGFRHRGPRSPHRQRLVLSQSPLCPGSGGHHPPKDQALPASDQWQS
jgi:hypothetical protein